MNILEKFQVYRNGIERRMLRGPSKSFWDRQSIITYQESHELVGQAILAQSPFATGRLGNVEVKIVLWGMNFPKIAKLGLKIPELYSDTFDGASNAGIRPRNPCSYREFAKLAFDSSEALDLLAAWSTPYEYAVVKHWSTMPAICDGECLSPTTVNVNHWADCLAGRKVLVVSPFRDSIQHQLSQMDKVWPGRGWGNAQYTVIQFPYLIDDDFPRPWQDVWNEMNAIVSKGDYDVALFGCGGLGLPLAAAAKAIGRVGVHLGGHLQLLFGIYGQRHIEQDWHARAINDYWIRPHAREIPKTFLRVEKGCYW